MTRTGSAATTCAKWAAAIAVAAPLGGVATRGTGNFGVVIGLPPPPQAIPSIAPAGKAYSRAGSCSELGWDVAVLTAWSRAKAEPQAAACITRAGTCRQQMALPRLQITPSPPQDPIPALEQLCALPAVLGPLSHYHSRSPRYPLPKKTPSQLLEFDSSFLRITFCFLASAAYKAYASASTYLQQKIATYPNSDFLKYRTSICDFKHLARCRHIMTAC